MLEGFTDRPNAGSADHAHAAHLGEAAKEFDMPRRNKAMLALCTTALVLAAGAPAAAGPSEPMLHMVELGTWGSGGYTLDVNVRGDVLEIGRAHV